MRKFTNEDHKLLCKEWKEELSECDSDDWGSDFSSFSWQHFEIPTGKMYYLDLSESILITHEHFLEHGRRWTEKHDPLSLNLVGGSAPF